MIGLILRNFGAANNDVSIVISATSCKIKILHRKIINYKPERSEVDNICNISIQKRVLQHVAKHLHYTRCHIY